MLGTLNDVSAIFAIGNVVTTLLLVPALLNKETYIPRVTSLTLMAVLSVFTLADWDLGLYSAAVVTAWSVGAWLAIFIWRSHGGKKEIS